MFTIFYSLCNFLLVTVNKNRHSNLWQHHLSQNVKGSLTMSETFGPVKLSVINAGIVFIYFFYKLLKSCSLLLGLVSQ